MTKIKKNNRVMSNEGLVARGTPPPPKIFEMFGSPGWTLDSIVLAKQKPNAFNGEVDILKYRITVEVVNEPVEAYQERLQKLWDECDNHHHVGPLETMATIFGYRLELPWGTKREQHD